MDTATIAMVAVGVIIGVLAMSNFRLRQEVASLRTQVAALVKIVTDIRGETFDESDRKAVGRLRRAYGLDTPSGWAWGGAGVPEWHPGSVDRPDHRSASRGKGRTRDPLGQWDECDPTD